MYVCRPRRRERGQASVSAKMATEDGDEDGDEDDEDDDEEHYDDDDGDVLRNIVYIRTRAHLEINRTSIIVSPSLIITNIIAAVGRHYRYHNHHQNHHPRRLQPV